MSLLNKCLMAFGITDETFTVASIDKIELFLSFFLYFIPYAVLGVMTFPAILFSKANFYFSLIGMVVALI